MCYARMKRSKKLNNDKSNPKTNKEFNSELELDEEKKVSSVACNITINSSCEMINHPTKSPNSSVGWVFSAGNRISSSGSLAS
jgi:hypothetical protein